MQKLIRNSASFYLLLLVLLKVLAVPVICLHYQLNKAYIAANLCENKSKPVMHCNGKCHLRKQLAKTSETSDPQSQKSSTSISVMDYCEAIKNYSFTPDLTVHQTFETWQLSNTAEGHSGNVFHPPIA